MNISGFSGRASAGAWVLTFCCLPLWAFQAEGDGLFDHPVKIGQDPVFQEVGETLQAIPILRADFEQQKNIRALRRPLRSSGRFLFAKNMGICWRTLEPFENFFIMTPAGMVQRSEDGETFRISADEQPVVHGFVNIFMSLFSGHTDLLEEQFELFFQGTPTDWTLGLKPRGKIMKKFVTQIVLRGNRHIESLDFLEASGDRTLIRFSGLGGDSALTDEERRQFDF